MEDLNVLKRYRLDEIALIVARTTPYIPNFSKVNQPLITAEKLKWLSLGEDIHRLSQLDSAIDQWKWAKVPAKTIVFEKNSLDGANKHIFQCENVAYIAHDVVAIIPNESIILSDYLYYFFSWYQPNTDWRQLHHILIDIPSLEMQTNIVKLLKTSQQLLKNKKSLLTAVEELPLHIGNIAQQTEQHTRQLNDGFDQLQMYYNYTLHKIFTGELFRLNNTS